MTYCTCETPIMDVAHDAGCRRCGNPIDFTPSEPAYKMGQTIQVSEDTPNASTITGVVEDVFRGPVSGQWIYVVEGSGYYDFQVRKAIAL